MKAEEPSSLLDIEDIDELLFPLLTPSQLTILSMTSKGAQEKVKAFRSARNILLPICEKYISEYSNMSETQKNNLDKNFEDTLKIMVVPYDPTVETFKSIIKNPDLKVDPKLVAQLVDYPDLVSILLRLKQFDYPLGTQHVMALPRDSVDASLVMKNLGKFLSRHDAFEFITKHVMFKPAHYETFLEKLPECYIQKLKDVPSSNLDTTYSTAYLLQEGKLEKTATTLKHDCFSLALALRLVDNQNSLQVMIGLFEEYPYKPQIA